jgi:hypothetical protein
LPDPTVPTFSQASNKQPMPVALKPRQQWMRDTPPFLSDEDANHTYSTACAWMFGTEQTTAKYDPRDTRHPRHPQHSMALSIRSKISHALERHDFASDFPRKYVPSLAQSPNLTRKCRRSSKNGIASKLPWKSCSQRLTQTVQHETPTEISMAKASR